LKFLYGANEIKSIFRLIIQDRTGYTTAEILVNENEKLPDSSISYLMKSLEALVKGKPVQYVLGKSQFLSTTLKLNESVLIPRPETEELASLIIAEYRNSSPVILDAGTGSGCIAIALSKHIPNAITHAVDVSEAALNVAKENASLNRCNNIHFQIFDILNPDYKLFHSQKFDLIVSNPPYIPESERRQMNGNIIGQEPDIALFVPDNDPLLYYKQLLKISKLLLKENGKMYLEVHENYSSETVTLFKNSGFPQTKGILDVFDKPRFVEVCC